MLTSGGWGGLLSAAALMWMSRANGDSAATGLNGPSHWFLGESAPHRQRFTVRHTLVGLLTHQASSFFWGGVFSGCRNCRNAERHGVPRIAAEAACMAALAALVDLAVVPRRLTPGFERRLPAHRLALVYTAFGAGLAWAALRERRLERR